MSRPSVEPFDRFLPNVLVCCLFVCFDSGHSAQTRAAGQSSAHVAHRSATSGSTGDAERQGKGVEQEQQGSTDEQGATDEDKWDQWLGLLEQYKHQYGHVCVPQNHKFPSGDGAFFLSQIRVRGWGVGVYWPNTG